MVERKDACDHTERLADGHVDPVGPHRNGVALHLGNQTSEELHLRSCNGGVTAHFCVRVAAIGRIDQRQFITMATQQCGDLLQDPGALQRHHITPFSETLARLCDDTVDIGPTGVCNGRQNRS